MANFQKAKVALGATKRLKKNFFKKFFSGFTPERSRFSTRPQHFKFFFKMTHPTGYPTVLIRGKIKNTENGAIQCHGSFHNDINFTYSKCIFNFPQRYSHDNMRVKLWLRLYYSGYTPALCVEFVTSLLNSFLPNQTPLSRSIPKPTFFPPCRTWK